MSIYASLWNIKVPLLPDFDEEFVNVYAQAVPAHIGHPSCYSRDLYADFLPPPVEDYNSETDSAPYYRAVVILQEGRDKKDNQRYIDPLIVMSGKEYAEIPFQKLLERIMDAIGAE